MKWSDVFGPGRKLGLTSRKQQDLMGQAVCDTLVQKENLIVEAATGTGKSLAVLLPIIAYINKNRGMAPGGEDYRAVIATATKNLQDQYLSDLDRLGGIKYRSLKGRDNYLCFNQMKRNSLGNKELLDIRKKLEGRRASLGDGERSNVESILGFKVTDKQWWAISGHFIRCAEGKCAEEECFSTRARNLALRADIVVTNTAVLRVDGETRTETGEGFLGRVNIVVVDEAHELESALISGWTEEITQGELVSSMKKISDGLALTTSGSGLLGRKLVNASDGVEKFILSVAEFFSEYYSEQWDRVSATLTFKDVMSSSPGLIRAMHNYEDDGPERLSTAIEVFGEVKEFLESHVVKSRESGLNIPRKISVAQTATKNMIDILEKLLESLGTKDGVVVRYGVPYTVLASAMWNGKIKISAVPMDISLLAKNIWEDRTCILMSATLRDLTSNDFRYVKASLGFSSDTELVLDSVFDIQNKQLTYVTTGGGEIVDVPGAQYSMQELEDLIRAARGRTLVLFTARSELDHAAEHLRGANLPYQLLVQTRDVDKDELGKAFKNDTHSVMLATKSFFQGYDAPTEALSMVVLVKYPLPQYNEVCKNQIRWWRSRGFPNWYSSKSTETFQQAAGRVLRTETDYGVVALLDQRVLEFGGRITQTAMTAVQSLGSPVIRSIDKVEEFLK